MRPPGESDRLRGPGIGGQPRRRPRAGGVGGDPAIDDALPEPSVLIADAGNGMQRIRIDWSEIANRERGNNVANPCSEDAQDRTCVEMRVFIRSGDAGG